MFDLGLLNKDYERLRPERPALQASLSKVPRDQLLIPNLRYQTPLIEVKDEVHVEFALTDPSIVSFSHFLTDQECDELVAFAKNRLAPSTVVPLDGTEYVAGGETRKSQGAGMGLGETSLIARIEKKIAQITHTDVNQGEFLQVLYYPQGGEYVPHVDYFGYCAGIDTFVHPDRGGQRLATIIIYLNTVEEGGGTEFPSIGVKCAAIKGNACYFAYGDGDGNLDPRSLHAGLPVLAGEKWVAVKWIRELPHNH